MGTIKTGDNFVATVKSDVHTPGTTALAVVWIPLIGVPPTAPTIVTIAPGAMTVQKGVVPAGQMLMLDFDLPASAASKILIDVSINGASVAAGSEIDDTEWTFLVVP